jgi:glycerol-3-phosphate acyltransferase PlsY
VVAIGAAAFLGHLFPVFLRFRGGKGVATALGVFVAIAPIPAAIGFGAYAVVFAATRTSSLGSLAGALALPVATGILVAETATVALSITLSAVVFVRHRDNIRRLISRKESQV